jgi:hypothetical protein
MPQLDHRFMNAHLVTHRGHMMVAIGNREYSVPEAATLAGMPLGTLKSRLRAGMNIAEAMTRPVTEHSDRRRPGR